MSGNSPKRDKPWLFRTYAGHSTAKASNELYRRNLAKGQTGLSVAFDLPTQTGYDCDHILARGEVGKVGVPISHLGDMRSLFEDIPLGRDEHLDDHQCDGGLAARALCRARRGAGRRPRKAHRHGAERHSEGVSLARDLHLPAGAIASADQGRDRLYQPRDAEMEPDQCLLLSFAGGGSDAGSGACVRAGDSRGRARRGDEVGRGFAREIPASRRQHQLSSSMPACASSPRCRRCAPSSISGTRSPRSATA